AARKRDGPQCPRRLRHPPFLEAAVDTGVGPVALADDHNAARAGHPAQTRGRDGEVALLELPEDGRLVHLAMIAMPRPPGKCRAAHCSVVGGPTSTRARRSRA